MFSTTSLSALAALLLTPSVLAQAAPSVIVTSATGTTTSGPSTMTASSALKLAKKYTASEFMSDWDFYTDNDPTGGYVNYVSKPDAESLGLVATVQDGSFVMRADAENVASGRGRNSIRISSKAKFADGVYILDINHMPVGCGTWPAFWTVTKDGWPSGGEIDIIEGANSFPTSNSAAYNATSSVGFGNQTPGYPLTQDVASLHTADNCQIPGDTYMTGTVGSTTCGAYLNGNMGCGVELAGESTYSTASFGNGVNAVGGGWYAMWRDIEKSGGVYIYYWPKTATNVPDDVRYANASTTSVQDWGQPGANLSISSCKSDFNNHVIVFDVTFCGAYAGATYGLSGCPSTCTNFVHNNPEAFAEAYWSINSLRVYTSNGKAAADSTLSKGAIGGIVAGVAVLLLIVGFLVWRFRTRRAARRRAAAGGDVLEDDAAPKHTGWAGLGETDARDTLAVPAFHRDESRPLTSKSSPGTMTSLSSLPSSADQSRSVTPTPTPSSAPTKAFKLGFKTKEKEQAKPLKPVAFASAHSKSATLISNTDEETGDDQEFDTAPKVLMKNKQNKIQSVLITGNKKPRVGKTVLAPGKTARHILHGETASGAHHQADGVKLKPTEYKPNSWVG